MSRSYAIDAFRNLPASDESFGYHGSVFINDRSKLGDTHQYEIFLHLDQQSALPFALQGVAEESLLELQQGSVTPAAVQLLDRLRADFPELEVPPSLMAKVTFLKAE